MSELIPQFKPKRKRPLTLRQHINRINAIEYGLSGRRLNEKTLKAIRDLVVLAAHQGAEQGRNEK